MAKARVTFSDVNVTIIAPVGARIIELSEGAGSYIAYSCREGECGTCLLQVIKGEENLSKPSELEKKALLDRLREILDGWRNAPTVEAMEALIQRENFAGKKIRLACQTQVFGDVTVAPL